MIPIKDAAFASGFVAAWLLPRSISSEAGAGAI